ncbi:MAG: flagellar export chaperone FliS [Gammaproteobacteria bacterium]|nr:flagellar export chaperone FliS [Gammaproteobacteria bacterium]
MNSGARGALNQYKSIGTSTGVIDVTPHRLIQMLLEGALEKITVAKQAMAQGNIAQKGSNISLAISIIDGLRTSLDKSMKNDIVTNLDYLYEYMGRRLLEANLKNDAEILSEVSNLLIEIKSGWDAIPDDIRRAHAEGKLSAENPLPQVR